MFQILAFAIGYQPLAIRSLDPATRLARFRSQQFTVAVDTSPVAVDKPHRIAADWAIWRWPFGKEWEKIRELDIVFVHYPRYLSSRCLIFN